MMTNKILAEVIVPGAGKKFDVFIPVESRFSEVTKLVSIALSELTEGKYYATAESVLCDADTGAIYNINLTVGELNLKNGSRLMLI